MLGFALKTAATRTPPLLVAASFGWYALGGWLAPATPLLPQENIATFSIVACDTATGELAVAVHSKFLAVGALVPWAQAGVGAIAVQGWADPSYGPRALGMLAAGRSVEETLAALTERDESRSRRQVGVVDASGRSAAYTGEQALGYAGHITGAGFSVQGNLLAGSEVLRAMADTFRVARGALAERLLAALVAGQQAGGDRRGQQSAALLVVRRGGGYAGGNDRYVDLRVDDHAEPIAELLRLYGLHEQTVQAAVHLRLGAEYKKTGKQGAAPREFARALRIAQRYPADHALANRVAWNLAMQDELLPEALVLIKQAIAQKDSDASYWDTLAEVHGRLRQWELAIAAQTRASQLAPDEEKFRLRLQNWQELAGRGVH